MSDTYKIHDILNQREEFLVIGLTGRMGSGCSKVAQLLATPYDELKFPHPVPQPGLQSLTPEERAIRIIAEYADAHWLKFDVIQVGALIATFILEDDRRFVYDLSRGGDESEQLKLRQEFRRSCLEDFYRQLVLLGQSCKLLDKNEDFYIREFTDPEERKKAEEKHELDSYVEIFPNFFVHCLMDETYRNRLKNEVGGLGKKLKRLTQSDKEVVTFFKGKGKKSFLATLLSKYMVK